GERSEGNRSAATQGDGSGRLDCADKVKDVRPGAVEAAAGPSDEDGFAGNPQSTIHNPQSEARLLIIEDNQDAADSLRDLLELHGCTVEVAYTGPEGVQRAREFRPEAVLCDLGLPGMSGYEVAAQLRQDPALARVRLIAISGYGQEEDRRRAR